MKRLNDLAVRGWTRLGPGFLPFADAASAELPLSRLLRLSLFQVSVGMALVLLNGTLNRVMIVELAVPTWLVAAMISLPLVFAPLRALVGFRSDQHRSPLGWRRVPYIWVGTLLQWGGLAIMPFSLLILSGDTTGPVIYGHIGAALAFLMVGAGLHTTQTAGLALATDLAPEDTRPRVVALLYVMLLAGMFVTSLIFGALLSEFTQVRLIQVVQGAAVATFLLNMLALWKQEPRRAEFTRPHERRPGFRDSWRRFTSEHRSGRLLIAVALGAAGFSMQDILLEPYGGEILALSVGATTELTALVAAGSLAAFAVSARQLSRGSDPHRLAGVGAVLGIAAFIMVIFAAPVHAPAMFRVGTTLIGFGGGLFAVGTLIASMQLARAGASGLALGAWGAVQATAAGLAIAAGGALRDGVSQLAAAGYMGPALVGPAVSYGTVYLLEIVLLLAAIVALGPLVRPASESLHEMSSTRMGLAELPG